MNLGISGTNSSAIKIFWEEPTDINGVLFSYIISWQDEYKKEPPQNQSVSYLEKNSVISDLLDCSGYDLDVRATTNNGSLLGKPTSINATTLDTRKKEHTYIYINLKGKNKSCYLLDPIPPVTDLATARVKSESLRLLWTAPATNCPVKKYSGSLNGTVLWDQLSDDYQVISVDGNETSVLLHDLVPYTSYKISLRAIGLSSESDFAYLQVNTTESG